MNLFFIGMFLQGHLEEKIYTEFPLGFGYELAAKKVCKLKRAPYGPKQSSGCGLEILTSKKNMGYRQIQKELLLYRYI